MTNDPPEQPPPGPTPPQDEARWRQGDVRTALKTIGLCFAVIGGYLAFYFVVLYLTKQFGGQPTFIAFALFITFALTIAIVLRVALNEIVDPRIDNPLVKSFGATPSLIIISIILAMLSQFTPVASLILPQSPRVMLAEIGITCIAATLEQPRSAPRLLTVIAAHNADYVHEVRKFFDKRKNDAAFQSKYRISWVKQERADRFFELLERFKDTKYPGAVTLSDSLKDPANWLAYTVPINAPNTITPLPVPSIFQQKHKTWVFVVTANPETQRAISREAESAANLPVEPQDKLLPNEEIRPLFHVDIGPKWGADDWQQADLAFEVFRDQLCWLPSQDRKSTP